MMTRGILPCPDCELPRRWTQIQEGYQDPAFWWDKHDNVEDEEACERAKGGEVGAEIAGALSPEDAEVIQVIRSFGDKARTHREEVAQVNQSLDWIRETARDARRQLQSVRSQYCGYLGAHAKCERAGVCECFCHREGLK